MNPYVRYSPIVDRPPIAWPGGAAVAVWVALNLEHYEYIPRGNARRSYWTRVPAPDVMEYASRDYGNRVGFWRMLNAIDRSGVPMTASVNAGMLELFPEIAAAVGERSWAVLGHGGYNTRYVHGATRDEEKRMLLGWLDTIERTTGKRAKGLQAAGSATENTIDLMPECGLAYSCDFFCDDQPFPIDVEGGRLVSVPYALDVNDGMLIPRGIGKSEADDFVSMITEQLVRLLAEGVESGRVLCIPVHPFVLGRPERIRAFEAILDAITRRDAVWVTTAEEIANHYLSQHYDAAVADLDRRTRAQVRPFVRLSGEPSALAEPQLVPSSSSWSPMVSRPQLRLPHGARVAVCLLVCAEHLEWNPPPAAIAAPTAAAVTASPARVHGTSYFDYGLRVGIYRVMEELDRRELRATVAVDALAALETPFLVDACLRRGWEVAGHGLALNRLLHDGLTPEDERAEIEASLDLLTEATGSRPIGWLSPDYGESTRTLGLLAELGLRYVCDWPDDDQPHVLTVGSGRLVSLPVAIELDDVLTHRGRGIGIAQWARMVIDAFDRLHAEGLESGRVLVIPLHAHLIGNAARIGGLASVLDHIAAHEDVWFATAAEIVEATTGRAAA